MLRECGACGTQNPDEARFCFSCGAPFTTTRERRERKFATVLFADLVGYTSLSERSDPEVVRSLVARTFERFTIVIERHGGMTEKFMGDAVLAVFGVPAAHEDDPSRAVRAALEMQSALEDLNRTFAAEGRERLGLRVGIEAGEVLVDLDRVAGTRDRMLTGDTVNTAARLEQSAQPGSVVVGPVVRDATQRTVRYRALPPLRLKGKSEPVPAFQALGVLARPAEQSSGLRARLIGRAPEIALLERAFRRVVSEGRPTLATVLGPAGVGKSRIAQEFLGSVSGARISRGRCLAYGNASYSAFADAVKADCGIHDDDPADVVRAKVERLVEEVSGGTDLVPHLAALVGSVAEQQVGRQELFEGWRRFLECAAAKTPVVLVLEDLHWADEGLLDFVDHVADWGDGSILILALSRPELLERRPGWGVGKRSYLAVSLGALTRSETGEMLEDLLGTTLSPDLKAAIAERCEGNPLFGEEIVRALIDRSAIRRAPDGGWEVGEAIDLAAIPRSIHALLAARIDALADDERAALQDASVVGRTFWVGAVDHLSGRPSQDLMSRLVTREVLVEREASTFSGEIELSFRHVLIRDVAYESLPKLMRVDKHAAVARWAEDHAGERREEIAELLATHYIEALRYLDELAEANGLRSRLEQDGLRWCRTAGERARRLWEQRDAVRWFRHALDLAWRTGAPDGEQASQWESYALACEGVEPYRTVHSAFARALELYDQIGDESSAGRVEAWLAFVAFQMDEDVLERAEHAIQRLEPLGDSRDLALALTILGWYHRRHGRAELGEPILRRASDMAARAGDAVTQVRAMVSLGRLLYQAGKADEGIPLLERALDVAREAGDLSLLLRAYVDLSEAHEEATGDYRRAEALVHEGLELARRAGHEEQIAWMEGNRSDCMFDLGSLGDDVEAAAQRALKAGRAVGEIPRIGYTLVTMAVRQAMRGDLDAAEQTLEEVRRTVQNPDPYVDAWASYGAALVAAGRGDGAEAVEIARDAAERLGDRVLVWGGQNLLLETVRLLVRARRVEDARLPAARLRGLASWSVPAAAFAAWADGLLAPDAERARASLASAVARFESLERAIELGRCLVDLADAERRAGLDPAATLARARSTLEAVGASLFLRDVAAAGRA